MKIRTFFLALTYSVLAGVVFAAGGTRIRVIGQRVNLRSTAGGKAHVVHVVSEGDVLVATKGLAGDWVAVKAPADVGLWVYGELVRDGRVSVPKLDARSGAGIDSQIICRLKEGDRVTVKGRSGDWLKIAPPSGCVLYISRKYVENVLSPRKKPPVKRVKAARSPKVVDRKPPKPVIRLLRQQTYTDTPSVVSRPPAPPAPKYDDVFHREMLSVSCTQGKKVIYDGLLRKSGPIPGCPGQYRLAARDSKGRALTRCYVKGNSAQLASFLGRRLRIEGTEYWLHGIRLSVVVPERIVLEN